MTMSAGCGSHDSGLQIYDAKDNKVNSRSLLRCKPAHSLLHGRYGICCRCSRTQQAVCFTLPGHTDTSKAVFLICRLPASVREQQDPKGSRSNHYALTLDTR